MLLLLELNHAAVLQQTTNLLPPSSLLLAPEGGSGLNFYYDILQSPALFHVANVPAVHVGRKTMQRMHNATQNPPQTKQ